MFTEGIQMDKNLLAWKKEDIPLLSRGLVCAYPVLRGTNFFDKDWLL